VIKLLIVDDHDLVRVGLRHIIGSAKNVEVVGEAGSGEEALKKNRQLKPDVILLDVSMPGLSGFEVTRRIKQVSPRTKIIILTVHAEAPYPSRLLDAGASGYLTKGCEADELLEAIDRVSQGDRFIGTDIAQQLALSLLPGSEQSPFDDLSSREMEVALMLIQGMAVPEIATLLSLSPKTVATYKYRVYDKLEVNNEVALVKLALSFGIMESQG